MTLEIVANLTTQERKAIYLFITFAIIAAFNSKTAVKYIDTPIANALGSIFGRIAPKKNLEPELKDLEKDPNVRYVIATYTRAGLVLMLVSFVVFSYIVLSSMGLLEMHTFSEAAVGITLFFCSLGPAYFLTIGILVPILRIRHPNIPLALFEGETVSELMPEFKGYISRVNVGIVEPFLATLLFIAYILIPLIWG